MTKEPLYRLAKHITFLEAELKDYEKFESLSWSEYNQERSKRRDVEKWIENIVNSSIDIAKIILSVEGISLADTYKDTVVLLSLVSGFNKDEVESLSGWVKLRNIISHEYLDIRWSSIQKFISETKPLYEGFLGVVRRYIEIKAKS
ncbi:MAG: DUF86 domain-containing protein [Planctomycetes bacterium]|nr:DUF86 domain-containing protein [Planctomycetota bacterium]